LTYAGDNKAAQEKLAADLEKSKKDIANREAKAKQKQALFNIAIDTAQGVVAALASTPPNIVLSAIIAAIGLGQIAVVSSQKVPQYFKGGTHDGGLMMVNDGGGSNFRETILYPDGKMEQPQGRNVIMDAPKGTKIFTHDQFNEQLYGMMRGNGINMNVAQQTPPFDYNAMDGIMHKYLGNVQTNQTVLDKRGFTNYIVKSGNRTQLNSNFVSGTGITFK